MKAILLIALIPILLSGCVNIQPEPTIYHGITLGLMSFRPDENYGCTQTDIDNFKAWGVDSVGIQVCWAGKDGSDYTNGIEPNENIVGNPITGEGYSQASLSRLHAVVDLIEANGMYVWLLLQPIGKGTVDNPDDWAQKYGNSFITFNEKPTGTPMPGRDRFINFIKLLCNEFPNAGIAPWWFAYHMDSSRLPNTAIETAFYDICQPAMINAIRETDELAGRLPREIAIYPLLQGIWTNDDGVKRCTGGLMEQPYYDDEHILYGLNSHDGDAGRWGWIVRENERWNYNMAKFNDQWAGAVYFKERYPEARLVCHEWIGLCIHSYTGHTSCGERPINKTRMDWTKAMFEKAIELDMSWTYWGYLHQPLPGGPGPSPEDPIESDGTPNEMAYVISYYNKLRGV
jgi:hypothetical protein